MTPAAMDELSALFLHGGATIEERELLQDAVQADDVETLDDLGGAAAVTLDVLRARTSA